LEKIFEEIMKNRQVLRKGETSIPLNPSLIKEKPSERIKKRVNPQLQASGASSFSSLQRPGEKNVKGKNRGLHGRGLSISRDEQRYSRARPEVPLWEGLRPVKKA